GEPETVPVTEDIPLSPINPYGHSKRAVEQIIRDCSTAHGLRYAILRYFNVAGADPQGRAGQCQEQATHLIYRACKTALGEYDSIHIFGEDYPTSDGTCVRDYIHVADLATAHVAALGYLLQGGESVTLNCG